MIEFKTYHDLDRANWDVMREIYASVGWKKHTNEIIQKIFEASNVITLVEVNGRIVGFGRAISDGVFNAAIYDVVVHCDFQKLGIGKNIVNDLLERLKHISCVHLIATTNNEKFYQRLGFKKAKTGMARYLNEDLEREYLE